MTTRDPARTPLDFTQLIRERTEHFTGREWVLAKLDAWLRDAGGARVFLLAGGPGTGKTAIAARVVQLHLGEAAPGAYPALAPGFLEYFHFCQAGLDSTLSPMTFVERLSEALANHHPAFRAALERQGSTQYVLSPVVQTGPVASGGTVVGVETTVHVEILGGDARPMFDLVVRRPLEALCAAQPGERIVILVDSIDEALSFGAENNIGQLLRLAGDLPPQVRLVLTGRSNEPRVVELVGPPAVDLVADAPPGLDEVKRYATTRLAPVPEPRRAAAAARIAEKSRGNFLYAYHVLNDLLARGGDLTGDALDLPDALEDVYRRFLERTLGADRTRWNDAYRPVVGAIAVARGEGLAKARLVGITGLAEDTASDVLEQLGQYLVGGDGAAPYRLYHQSFRDFLLADRQFGVFPAERHAAIARHLQDEFGASWGTCRDEYALRYTPVHWAEAATLSEHQRATRTQALVELTGNPKYQRAFERRVGNLPLLHEHVHRAVQAAALNERADMLPWLLRAAQAYVAFRREYLQAEAVARLAEAGRLEEAEERLRLFTDVGEDWQLAARLVLAWLGAGRDPGGAERLRARAAGASLPGPTVHALSMRLLGAPGSFAPRAAAPISLEVARELVNRISGQAFDRELLRSVSPTLAALVNPRLLVAGRGGPGTAGERGYAAALDGPALVDAARLHGPEGTRLLDQYVDAHAGYNYVEYRNRSLWFVLDAVVHRHPDPAWVRDRLRRILVAALTGGGAEFREALPLTAALLAERARTGDARPALERWRQAAFAAADALQARRGADDSWGTHRRRLTALLELSALLVGDRAAAGAILARISALPGGFAGFQAPARLRLADGLRAAGMDPAARASALHEALVSAHHVQDYHFCARVTARCNALVRWHAAPLAGDDLAAAIRRLAAAPADAEFAADHAVHEPYAHRPPADEDVLPIADARDADTLERLVEVFQRPAVELRRLNPQLALSQRLAPGTPIRVPDPGFPPLLAIHLAARALADGALEADRAALCRALVPVAAANPTALDTVLGYLLVASDPDDEELVLDLAREAGQVSFVDLAAPTAQIGPDAPPIPG